MSKLSSFLITFLNFASYLTANDGFKAGLMKREAGNEYRLTYGTTVHSSFVDETNDGKYVLKGIEADILQELQLNLYNSTDHLTFTSKFVGNPSYRIDPWKKLMKSLSKKEVDMVLPFGYLTPEVMANSYDTSNAVFPVVYGVVIKRPQVGDSFKEYLKPYDIFVWMTIAASIVIVGFILATTYYYSPVSGHGASIGIGEQPMQQFTIGNSIFAIFGALFQQDRDGPPRYPSGRVVFTTYFICSYMVLQGYSAGLTSFLAAGTAVLPFNDVESLAMNSHFTVGTDDLFDIIEILRTSRDPNIQIVAKKIMVNPKSNLISNPEQAIDRVLNENFAYLTAVHTIEPYLRRDCSLVLAVPEVIRLTKHLILKQNHTFTHLISKQLSHMRSTGIVQRIYSKYYPKIPNICDQGRTTVNPITMVIFHPVFDFLSTGIFISLSIVVVELFWRSKQKKNGKIDRFSTENNGRVIYYRHHLVYRA